MANATTRHSRRYALFGFLIGLSAPVGWTVLRLMFFADPKATLAAQIFADVTRDAQAMTLYFYLTGGAAFLLASFGSGIDKIVDKLRAKQALLDRLLLESEAQKGLLAGRYRLLDKNIKNFHVIANKIQSASHKSEVLCLCVEELHMVLGYQRVNVLLVDPVRDGLYFAATAGDDCTPAADTLLPLDERSGAIYKCFKEQRPFFIEDIAGYPADYRLHPPFDRIASLRSAAFVLCPIVIKGRTIGVLGMDTKGSSHVLSGTEIDSVQLFADQTAAALSRIELLQSIDRLTLELGRTFSDLQKNRGRYVSNLAGLKVATNSLANDAVKIDGSATGTLEAVNRASLSAGEISLATDRISNSMDRLFHSVFDSVSAMDEIAATLRQVEENSVSSQALSGKVTELAERSGGLVQETIASLATIQHSVELSYDAIKRLSANSGRIEGFINVINDITKRTNLLALNATIIASRAGQHGRTFGVVANELRNLALQIGQSTEEITCSIDEIMNESWIASEQVTRSKGLVDKGVKLGQQTAEALESMRESSLKAANMTRQIRQVTKRQSVWVRGVTESIDEVNFMTTRIFSSSKEQVQATRCVAQALDAVKRMCFHMTESAARQTADGAEIKAVVESVTQMAGENLDCMEQRHRESEAVVKELGQLRASVG